MGKKRRCYMDGSYTVEAAFLIPMILGIVYAWIFMIFYLHDQVVACGLLQEAAISQKEIWNQKRQKQGTIETSLGKWYGDLSGNNGQNELQEQIQPYLWVVQSEPVRKKKGPLCTKFVLKGKASWNIPVMHNFLGDMRCRITVKTGNLRPATLLRAGLHQNSEEDETGNNTDGERGQ